MYPAIANSPGTELSADIAAADTTISVLDASKLPEAPNLITVGSDETAETVLYTGKTGNDLTGCTRGFNGTAAKGWSTGAKVARLFTAYDHDTFRANISDLDTRVTAAQAKADAAETPAGAQAKADAAEQAAEQTAAQNLSTHAADGSAHGIGDKSTLLTTQKSTIVGSINELFTSVSDGKTAIAAAITDKGVVASGSDTFPQLATKIGQISTGPKYATGTTTSSSSSMDFQVNNVGSISKFPYILVSGLGFRPNRIIIRRGSSYPGEISAYDYDTRSSPPSSNATNYNFHSLTATSGSSGYVVWTYEMSGSNTNGTGAYVNDSSFRLPVVSSNTVFTWEAYRV